MAELQQVVKTNGNGNGHKHVIKWKTRTQILFAISIVLFLLFSNQIRITMNKSKEIKNDLKVLGYMYKYCQIFEVDCKTTLYSLHPSECSKDKNSKYFGITRSGYLAVIGRTVAVDPRYIPLGSIVKDVETGINYIAEDTGNKVLGWHIDRFIGEGTPANVKLANDYGVKTKRYIVFR